MPGRRLGNAALLLGALLLAAPREAPAQERPEPASAEVEALRVLAQSIPVHGLPPDALKAGGFDRELARPILIEMLADPAEQARWPVIAALLGQTGGAEAREALRNFLLQEDAASSLGAKLGALEGLASLARDGDDDAIILLAMRLRQSAWSGASRGRGSSARRRGGAWIDRPDRGGGSDSRASGEPRLSRGLGG
jgi:hypothetical protein